MVVRDGAITGFGTSGNQGAALKRACGLRPGKALAPDLLDIGGGVRQEPDP
jgi:hypothetical protein